MIGQFCDKTVGKECGLNESSHLLGRSLRDETKTAVKETSVEGMVCFFIFFIIYCLSLATMQGLV